MKIADKSFKHHKFQRVWEFELWTFDPITEKTNTRTIKKKNVMSTVSINCHGKKVRDCYILHKVLSVIILLLIITIICYHCVTQKGIIWNRK